MTDVLVLGATGSTGGELVRLLETKGARALRATHRPARNANDVQLDLSSGAGVREAFARTRRSFLMCPPGFTNQDVLLGRAIDAAREARHERVVLMSAMGADADPTAPMRKAELALERSGLAFAILRPNWFMQNFHTFWLHSIRTLGRIQLPVGSAKGSFIDTRDTAACAAELLVGAAPLGKAYDLTGPQALDHTTVAAILSRISGRDIQYEDITPEAARAGLLAAGLPADYAEFLLLILSFFRAGYSARTTDNVQLLTGRAPTTFERYAQDHRQAWA
ncbi:MAG: NAD(P)H-binding protein [Planctomycetota bacterium]|nr:NAD(P)H-binding protein [Planctomycetota bacterium]